MKTIREWLEELPDGYRERAIKNLEDRYGETEARTQIQAITLAFDWDLSPEGDRFWDEFTDSLLGFCDPPKLPPLEMNGHTKESFILYLKETLIPDLKKSGMECTAEDFETCIAFMQ